MMAFPQSLSSGRDQSISRKKSRRKTTARNDVRIRQGNCNSFGLRNGTNWTSTVRAAFRFIGNSFPAIGTCCKCHSSPPPVQGLAPRPPQPYLHGNRSRLTATSIYSILGYSKVGYSLNGMNVDANRACGSCLSQIRREQGITQVELAKRLRTPQSFVSKIETGERSLKVYEQFAYAEALGITPEEMTARLKKYLDH